MDPSRTPVVVGAAQVRGERGGTREPLALVLDAVRAAGEARLLARADTVLAVGVASWSYDSVAARVGTAVGAVPRHRTDSPTGGHWPARLLDEAAARIAAGESQVALVVGGEAQAARRALGDRDPVEAGWTPPAEPPPFDADAFGSPQQLAAGLLLPTRAYAVFENRLQADLGLTAEESAQWSARLYADLSQVAARNPAAWSPEVRTPEEVATPTAANRMVCEPYVRAVNAMPNVDQAAAVVVTSLAVARDLGVAHVSHVWGGAGVDDVVDLLARDAYGASRALSACLDAALERSPVRPGLVDVYSCFPVVPKLAALHLGLPRDAVLSATGGHASFGGPLNSYSLHAVVAAHERLRDGEDAALVHANGGLLTYQHAVLLGRRPHPDGYVGDPVPRRLDPAGPGVAEPADTDLLVEAATVEHGREGGPAQAFVVGRTPEGLRAAAWTDEAAVARQLSLAALPPGVRTHVGRRVRVRAGFGAAVVTEVL